MMMRQFAPRRQTANSFGYNLPMLGLMSGNDALSDMAMYSMFGQMMGGSQPGFGMGGAPGMGGMNNFWRTMMPFHMMNHMDLL